MEIEIGSGKEKRIVLMKNVKNKHVQQLMTVLKSMRGLNEDDAIIKLNDLLEVRNKIAKELAGFTDEQWAELDVDDAQKFTSIVAQKTFGDLDFSKLFKKQQG